MSHRYPEHIADKAVNAIADRAPGLPALAGPLRGRTGIDAYLGDIAVSAELAGFRMFSPDDAMGLVGACERTGAPKPEEVAVWRMWSGSRAVYRFDASLADALAETDGTAGLSLGQIEAMLPLDCFFIEEPLDVEILGELVACKGFYVLHPVDGLIQLSFIGAGARMVRSDTVRVEAGDVGAAVDVIMGEDAAFGYAELDGYDEGLARDATRRAFIRALASIVYLETPDAEIVEAGRTPAPSRKHKGGAGQTASWTVGSAIGGRMRAYDSERAGTGQGGGTVRPHMRRAHWSHYWVGPRDGERRLEPRWIHPVFVNGGEGELPVTTVHPVRRAE